MLSFDDCSHICTEGIKVHGTIRLDSVTGHIFLFLLLIAAWKQRDLG